MLALLTSPACSEVWPHIDGDSIVFRVELSDEEASFVSYRVWDERFQLVSDVLLSRDEIPRYVRVAPDPTDPTAHELRGGLIEVESWSASLCPRDRVQAGFRYGVTNQRNTILLEEPERAAPCQTYFVSGDGDDDADCTQPNPCAQPRRAIAVSQAVRDRRIVIHVAGGHDYAPFGLGMVPWQSDPLPHVIRAWPGTSLPEPPVIEAGDPKECAPNDSTLCDGEAICVDNRCPPPIPVVTCCDYDGTGPSNLELDGLTTRRGRYGVELNGSTSIRVRHFTIDAGGGALPRLPSGGIRIHRSRSTVIEHTRIRDSVDLTGRSLVPAVGILVDGAGQDLGFNVELQHNRVESADGAGLYLLDSQGHVSLTGNAWCGHGGPGIQLVQGTGEVSARSEVIANNDSAGLIRSEAYTGRVSLDEITFGPGQASLSSTQGIRIDRSVVFEVEVEGDNLVDPLMEPSITACLPAVAEHRYGACASFPYCP